MIGLLRRNHAMVALVLLLGFGAVVAQLGAERNEPANGGPPLASRDAGPNGSLALALWLDRLGYRVTTLAGATSTPDDAIGDLFVLEPAEPFSASDARAVLDWVRRGGTLVYVPGPLAAVEASDFALGDQLGTALDVRLQVAPGPGSADVRPAVPSLPFFDAPRGTRFTASGPWILALGTDAWVPLLELPSGSSRGNTTPVVAAERRYGSGRAYAVSAPSFFDNTHLSEADNASLVLNILARGGANRVVAFDEYHHGEITAPDLAAAVRGSPWGWALIYGATLTFIFAVWSGRRFGPPLIRERQPGRSTADYVTAFAGLLQRNPGKGGTTITWAQGEYRRLVRRALARAHGVRADLPAGELARILAERRPIDAAELARGLGALDGPPLGERRLLAELRSLEAVLRKLVALE
jgi:hypothetical protein